MLFRSDGTLAAPGEPGEIVVRSPYLARSYWKDPEATARAFQTDPDGTRVYRSGDLGRWRADGLLEHLGRKTRKIKIRGFSVEPREVECALLALPGVRDAIVTTSEEASDDIRMIAYAVMDGSRAGDAANSLRAVLTKSLPAHMVPTHVVVLDAFPLNARGKIDRAALPSPSIEKVRDRKSTRLNSSHIPLSRMPSSA